MLILFSRDLIIYLHRHIIQCSLPVGRSGLESSMSGAKGVRTKFQARDESNNEPTPKHAN